MAGDPIAAQTLKNVTSPQDLVEVAKVCVTGKAFSEIPQLSDVDFEPAALDDLDSFIETGKTPTLDRAVEDFNAEVARVKAFAETVTREWERLKAGEGKQVAQGQ